VSYDDKKCKVYFNDRLVWHDGRESTTGLWVLLLRLKEAHLPDMANIVEAEATVHSSNVFVTTFKAALIQYLHQALFSPTESTLLHAIRNNQLRTWPVLTLHAVRKYLPETSAQTDKDHMKRQQQGIRSTKENQTLMMTRMYKKI
jgi:hypothetical protein